VNRSDFCLSRSFSRLQFDTSSRHLELCFEMRISRDRSYQEINAAQKRFFNHFRDRLCLILHQIVSTLETLSSDLNRDRENRELSLEYDVR
jgi:hypothetical protein